MAIYVMSDIHGEADRFYNLLEAIRFSPEDTLYILGDVADRGDGGIGLLQYIMTRPNIRLILGNHESMFLEATADDSSESDIFVWVRNGGGKTLQAFLNLTEREQEALRMYLQGCPDHAEVTVNGAQRYYLVHGWPASSAYERYWRHPPYGIRSQNPFADKMLIVGHTVTIRLYTEDPAEQRDLVEKMLEEGTHLRICRTPEFIALDCGSGHLDIPVRRLACLRLDDAQEFYA